MHIDEHSQHRSRARLVGRAVLLLLGATLCVASPRPARATEDPRPNGIAKDKGDELFDQGVSAFDAGRYEEAEQFFQAAWKIKQTFDIAGNLGLTELKLGKQRAAAEHLNYALQHFPPTETAEKRAGLEAKLGEARGEVSTVRIQSNVDGSAITIDGHPVGVTPLANEIFVDPGEHTIEVTHEGFLTERQTVRATKASKQDLAFSLQPSPTTTPESDGPNAAYVAIGFGSAVVLAGVGLGFVIAAGNKDDQRADLIAQHNGPTGCSTEPNSDICQQISDASASERTLRGIGVGGIVAGGAVLGATVVYAFWPRTRATSTSRGFLVVPTAGFGQAGLQASGHF